MAAPLAEIVNVDILLEVIGAAFVAGIVTTAIFGLVIYGGTRFADLRREGNGVGAAFFAAFATIGFAAFVASVVIGIIVMTHKS